MNSAQIHLALNHFPLIGGLIAAGLLLYGLARRNRSIAHAGMVVMVLMSLISLPVYFSGEEAEEILERQNVSHNLIHEHEEAAETAFLLLLASGIVSLAAVGLSVTKRQSYLRVGVIALGVIVVTMFFTGYAAKLGGEIRHPEVQDILPPDEVNLPEFDAEDYDDD